MNSIEKAKYELLSLTDKTQFEKMVSTVGILTKLSKEINLKPIIVGGLAVEIYTRNNYSTLDIDIIFSQIDTMHEILFGLGFIKDKSSQRHFYHEQLMISIEIPNDMLEDADYNKVTEIELSNGDSIFVIGIEDIILDRLRGCIHWKSVSDCEWGRNMLLTHYENLDMDYMKDCLVNKGEIELFSKWVKLI